MVTRARATTREVRTCFVVKYLDRDLRKGGGDLRKLFEGLGGRR
jgi:hypothetical protein